MPIVGAVPVVVSVGPAIQPYPGQVSFAKRFKAGVANAGQMPVVTQLLDTTGVPIQDYGQGAVYEFGSGDYGSVYQAPPGFAGFARIKLANGFTVTEEVNIAGDDVTASFG